MLKTIFASVTAVAATVLLSIGASGATVQHFNLNGPQQCYAKGDYLVCVIASGEENAVQAPSGNFNAEINGTSSFVASYQGAVVATGTDVIHEHVLYTSDFTVRSEEHTSELQSRLHLVCRLLLEKKNLQDDDGMNYTFAEKRF